MQEARGGEAGRVVRREQGRKRGLQGAHPWWSEHGVGGYTKGTVEEYLHHHLASEHVQAYTLWNFSFQDLDFLYSKILA